jgi:hypothetical protein
MKIWPLKNQWRSWSLPSKLTAIGALVGIISLTFSIATYSIQQFLKSSTSITKAIPVKRTSDEITEIYNLFLSKELSGEDRVKHIQWISEGPARESMQLLESIAIGKFSMAEKNAAEFAIDDIMKNKKPENLVSRVKEERTKMFPSQQDEGGALVGLAVTMLYWERPDSSVYSTLLDSLGDAALGK